ncbi:hypothetical protein ACTXQV_59935, partial [Klebsiella pneumoniae]
MAFIAIWVLVVYAPITHWVWAADGWLFKAGALDFAGGTVVHINSGVERNIWKLNNLPPMEYCSLARAQKLL